MIGKIKNRVYEHIEHKAELDDQKDTDDDLDEIKMDDE